MIRIAALILAAGEASRYGSCKQLADLDGKSLLQQRIDVANEVFPDHVFVVTGAHHHRIAPVIEHAELLYNPDWKSGLGGSIAYGVQTLQDRCDALMIMLADQVAVDASHLSEMMERFSGDNIVCARYKGCRGVPAMFGRVNFDRLMKLKGNKGAKAFINSLDRDVVEIDLPQAGIDIDTPEDLRKYLCSL